MMNKYNKKIKFQIMSQTYSNYKEKQDQILLKYQMFNL